MGFDLGFWGFVEELKNRPIARLGLRAEEKPHGDQNLFEVESHPCEQTAAEVSRWSYVN